MNIRRIFAALVAAALLLTATAMAELDDFGFDFDDEGYTGTWMTIPELDIEFCLPDGWTQVEAGEDAAFAAVKDGGGAALAVRLEAEAVEDVVSWADASLARGSYEIDTTGFFDTLIVASADGVTVYRLNDLDQLLAFEFARASEGELSRDFALEIVESVSEAWTEDYEPYDEAELDDLLADIQALEGGED